ncbi:MAG TPA: biosynthetic-type acetolactate synthase large subunit [Gaiellales bacterium]|nr:biosynthetic-type acetolactate synthase large subunit [Gaiellales bacterium]
MDSDRRRMTGAEAVIRSLEAEGVTDVFGLPGGAILPLYDAWAACEHTIRHYLVRHEQGAGHMAQGYARATGKVGVAIATSGPGATNLVTPIADAYLDSTPIVCITGQVPTHLIGTDAFQEADITGITMPVVKHSWLVDRVEDIPRVVKEAFHIARSGRPGPVLIDIPKDLQLAEFEFSYPKQVDIPGYRPSRHGHPKQVITAAEAILAAERPVFYVGGGAVSANVDPADLIRVAESVQMPVITTLMAKGVFPDSHPLCIGLPGMHGSKAANWAMNQADLLIACGSRFDDRVTGKLDVFAPGAKVIHMDVDPAEIDKNRTAQIPIVGSLELVVPKLAEALQSRMNGGPPKAAPWLQTVQDWKQQHPFRYRNTEPLKPEYVIERLRDLTADRDVIWATGVGQHQMWAAQYLQIDLPRRWLTSGGLGTMGFGVPAAIGAKVGRPEATVINIDGDGCFQMTMQELATAKMYGIGAIHVVVNNGWLGMVRQWQELFHGERYSETLLESSSPDYVKLAESFGLPGFRCETVDEVDAAITAALECGQPCVIDARVDHEEKVYPMVPAGAASAEMIDVEWAEDDNAWVEEGV